MVVWCVEGEEGPCADEATDVAEHDVRRDGGAARGVGHDVCGYLGVAERAEGVGAGGDEEGRGVPRVPGFGS